MAGPITDPTFELCNNCVVPVPVKLLSTVALSPSTRSFEQPCWLCYVGIPIQEHNNWTRQKVLSQLERDPPTNESVEIGFAGSKALDLATGMDRIHL